MRRWPEVEKKDYLLIQRPSYRIGPLFIEWRPMAGCYRLNLWGHKVYLQRDYILSTFFMNKDNGIWWP